MNDTSIICDPKEAQDLIHKKVYFSNNIEDFINKCANCGTLIEIRELTTCNVTPFLIKGEKHNVYVRYIKKCNSISYRLEDYLLGTNRTDIINSEMYMYVKQYLKSQE